MRILFLVSLLFMLAGCGGTYVDSPKNFQRAFGQQPPKEAKIAHSYYWLSPHFTHEHEYFFEIENASNVVSMLTNGLPLARRSNDAWSRPDGNNVPKWFVPKERDSYEAWTWKTNGPYQSTFLMLRDKSDGRVFIHDQQL